jgi:hypothetical protein
LAEFQKSDQFSAMITSQIENFKKEIESGVAIEETSLGTALKTYYADTWKNPGEEGSFWKTLKDNATNITSKVFTNSSGTSLSTLVTDIAEKSDVSELLDYFMQGDYESANQ